LDKEAKAQREAVSPTIAGSAEFVMGLLIQSKRYSEDEEARHFLMQCIDDVQRNKNLMNKRHEEWRE